MDAAEKLCHWPRRGHPNDLCPPNRHDADEKSSFGWQGRLDVQPLAADSFGDLSTVATRMGIEWVETAPRRKPDE